MPCQKPIPGQNWRIRAEFEATSHVLVIFHLDQNEVASLYAAHDLYADVVQGNQPFDKEETLRFLAKELHGWIERVTGSSPVPPIVQPIESPSPELIEALRILVSTFSFLSLDMVQTFRLDGTGDPLVDLFAPDGARIGGGLNLFQIALQQSGPHTIMVTEFTNNATVSYRPTDAVRQDAER